MEKLWVFLVRCTSCSSDSCIVDKGSHQLTEIDETCCFCSSGDFVKEDLYLFFSDGSIKLNSLWAEELDVRDLANLLPVLTVGSEEDVFASPAQGFTRDTIRPGSEVDVLHVHQKHTNTFITITISTTYGKIYKNKSS